MHISFLFRITTTLIMVIFITSFMVSSASKRLSNHYLAIASTQADKVASLITLNSVSSLIKETYSQVSFIYKEDNLVFNSGELNYFLKDSIDSIYQEIRKVEEGTSDLFTTKMGKGIIYEVPFNLAFDNVLLSSFGPKIPVRYALVGDVKGEILSEIEEFGLNNAVINIVLETTISSRVSIPLISKLVTSKIKTIIYSEVFKGEVPSLMYGSIQGVNEYYSSEVRI